MITGAVGLARRPRRTFRFQLEGWICLPLSQPTPLNPLFRQGAAVSLLRRRVTRKVSDGILTVSSIGLALRRILRTRLTLNRLTLFRKPWSFGGRASHPPYRYLYLHLLYHALQGRSSLPIRRTWYAPLPILSLMLSRAFGTCLIPDYYPCPDPRLVSCYALFE